MFYLFPASTVLGSQQLKLPGAEQRGCAVHQVRCKASSETCEDSAQKRMPAKQQINHRRSQYQEHYLERPREGPVGHSPRKKKYMRRMLDDSNDSKQPAKKLRTWTLQSTFENGT